MTDVNLRSVSEVDSGIFEETEGCLRLYNTRTNVEIQVVDLKAGVLDFHLYTPPASDVETTVITLCDNGLQQFIPFDDSTKNIVGVATQVLQVDAPSEISMGFMACHGTVVASTLGKQIFVVDLANVHYKGFGLQN